MDEQRARHIEFLAQSEPGRALFDEIKDDIKQIEELEEVGLKISDIITEDFRFKLGMKAYAKRVLRKPQEALNLIHK